MSHLSDKGFALLSVLVTLTVLMLFWSAVCWQMNTALTTEEAAVSRLQNLDGASLAAAHILDLLQSNTLPAGVSEARVVISTPQGTFYYLVTLAVATGSQGGSQTIWTITVEPLSDSSVDTSVPIL